MSQFLAQRAKKASSLTADGFGYGATIDARVLWDLLRDLIRLGMEPSHSVAAQTSKSRSNS